MSHNCDSSHAGFVPGGAVPWVFPRIIVYIIYLYMYVINKSQYTTQYVVLEYKGSGTVLVVVHLYKYNETAPTARTFPSPEKQGA
jgi:hypothetical protein